MTTEGLFKDLYLLGNDVKKEEPLAWHTTMKAGGPAMFFASPYCVADFMATVRYLRQNDIPWEILGGGSNVVAPDFYRGVVVSTSHLTSMEIRENYVTAECGIPMQRLISRLVNSGLGGLEFAAGLPGTAGGSAIMNAGAFGGEMKDVVAEVVCLTPDNELMTIEAGDCGYGYRTSVFKGNDYVVLKVVYRLDHGNREELALKVMDILQRRVTRQPLDFPSAGSVFMRPRFDFYVGSTIDALGLKSLRVGDAEVSSKHAGFIINRGNATGQEIRLLVGKLQAAVYEATGEVLSTEIEFWERSDR